ncbi:hypothetical protein PCE1_004489 [Barthelona sp. PCE]
MNPVLPPQPLPESNHPKRWDVINPFHMSRIPEPGHVEYWLSIHPEDDMFGGGGATIVAPENLRIDEDTNPI